MATGVKEVGVSSTIHNQVARNPLVSVLSALWLNTVGVVTFFQSQAVLPAVVLLAGGAVLGSKILDQNIEFWDHAAEQVKGAIAGIQAGIDKPVTGEVQEEKSSGIRAWFNPQFLKKVHYAGTMALLGVGSYLLMNASIVSSFFGGIVLFTAATIKPSGLGSLPSDEGASIFEAARRDAMLLGAFLGPVAAKVQQARSYLSNLTKAVDPVAAGAAAAGA